MGFQLALELRTITAKCAVVEVFVLQLTHVSARMDMVEKNVNTPFATVYWEVTPRCVIQPFDVLHQTIVPVYQALVLATRVPTLGFVLVMVSVGKKMCVFVTHKNMVKSVNSQLVSESITMTLWFAVEKAHVWAQILANVNRT